MSVDDMRRVILAKIEERAEARAAEILATLVEDLRQQGTNGAGETGGAPPQRVTRRTRRARARDAEPVAAGKRRPTGLPARGDKVCTDCKKPKAKSDFAKNGSKSDGLQVQCRACQSARGRSKRTARGAKPRGKKLLADTEPRGARMSLLAERASLREGRDFVRCILPRVPGELETKLTAAGVCGALVMRRKAVDHLREVHGLEERSEELARVSFAAVEPVKDTEAA